MDQFTIEDKPLKVFYNNRYSTAYMEKHTALDIYRAKSLFKEIDIKPDSVLDYGCGQGVWMDILSSQFRCRNIYGIDISEKAIELASRKFPQYYYASFDGGIIPFADNYFDLIFSYHVMEHVYELEKAIFEISRILKTGGYIYIVCPCANGNSFEEKVTRLIKKGKENSLDGRIRFFYDDISHIRRMYSAELIDLFAQHNILLYRASYAFQFWGAIELISKWDPALIKNIFDDKKSINMSSKIQLLFLKLMMMLLSTVMQLRSVNFTKYIKRDVSITKKMRITMLMPLKPLASFIGMLVDLCALLEWRFFKTERNGSAQYLIFKKYA